MTVAPQIDRPKETILIIGPPAAGKSSFCRVVQQREGVTFVPADELYKDNPFFQRSIQQRERWSLTNNIWFLIERTRLHEEAEDSATQPLVLIDSGLPMSYAYAYAHWQRGFTDDAEWELYQTLFEEYAAGILPDRIVHIDAPVAVLRERVIARGREFEQNHHDETYLRHLRDGVNAAAARYADRGVPVEYIDTSEFELEGYEAVVEEVVG